MSTKQEMELKAMIKMMELDKYFAKATISLG